MSDNPGTSAEDKARFVRSQFPKDGLFDGLEWRVSPAPFPLGEKLAGELENLGRLLLQFNRGVNLLYRHSLSGKQPAWIAAWLDQGKPAASNCFLPSKPGTGR